MATEILVFTSGRQPIVVKFAVTVGQALFNATGLLGIDLSKVQIRCPDTLEIKENGVYAGSPLDDRDIIFIPFEAKEEGYIGYGKGNT